MGIILKEDFLIKEIIEKSKMNKFKYIFNKKNSFYYNNKFI
jgi:hypothetical protein